MTVSRTELHQPVERLERWDASQFWARIPWLVPWEDRYTFIDETGEGAGELYPPNVGLGARAFAASVVGFGEPLTDSSDSRLMSYSHAIVTVEYSTNAPIGFAGKYVTEELNDFHIGIPENNVDLVWSDKSPVTDQEAAFRTFPGTQYKITYHRLMVLPATHDTMKGYLNAGTWASYTLGLSWIAGRMLYVGGNCVRDLALGTLPKWRATYTFNIHPSNWNYNWKVGSGWQPVYLRTSPATQYLRYTSGNYNLLIP